MTNEKYTPYYVINKKILDDNIDAFECALNKYWKNSILSYSVKTNSLPWLLKYIKSRNIYAETVSDEEYQLSQMCGWTTDKIIFNGPIKGRECFDCAISGGSIVNIDSVSDIQFVKNRLLNAKKIGIRVNVNPEYFSAEDTTFHDDGFRFGFSDEGGGLRTAIEALKAACGTLEFGLHFHCNSSTRSINVYKSICKYARHIIEKYKLRPNYIDVGGGFFGGVEGKPTPEEYISTIKKELSEVVDVDNTTLIVEPGSAIIGSAVDLYTSVVDVKDTAKARIVTTDGSRLHVDPLWKKKNYLHDLKTSKQNILAKQIVCGYTCMDYDRIICLTDERELSVGDEVIYKRVGSYTMTFGGMFIRYLPEVYVSDGERLIKVRSRISVEDYYNIQS